MSFRVQFTAITAKRLTRIGEAAALRAALEQYTEQHAQDIMEEVREYPPEVFGSPYVRTYRLYNNWHVRPDLSAGAIRYVISNYTPYAGLVHGLPNDPTRQWPPHGDHGWRRIADAIEARGGRAAFKSGAQDIIDSYI